MVKRFSGLFLIFTCGLLLITEIVNSDTSPLLQNDEATVWQGWVDKYDESRRSKDGWLALAGLYWLADGENSLGSGKHNSHRFPEGMPSDFGKLNVSGNQINFVRSSKKVRIDGRDIDSLALIPNETVVSQGSYSFYIIERERGFAIRLKNIENPSIAAFDGTHFYPYSKTWLVAARLVRHTKPQKISIATVYASVRENDSAGWLEFDHQGQKVRLQAVSYGPDTPMMLMFADATSRSTTYGAGRFLDVEWPEEGDMTFLDFNRAYNPPCAITPFATCPLPPPQNRLSIAVEAGELFAGH